MSGSSARNPSRWSGWAEWVTAAFPHAVRRGGCCAMLGLVDPKKWLSSAGDKISDVVRSPDTAKKVSDLEDKYAEHRRSQKLEEGTLRGVRVAVHRGWVADGVARVHAQVMEAPKLPEGSSKIPYWDVLNANLRRHVRLSFPDVTVRATLGDVTAESVTDNHGYTSIHLDVGDLPPGWHEVTVATVRDDPDAEVFTGVGRVLVPAKGAKVAVISDLDDTVIRTGLDEGMVALRRTLFRDAHTRRAVPGMASLYRGLERGVPAKNGRTPPSPGFFYVSTGSWSFYEMLTQFLQLRGYPRGPLFLTDWGPTDRYIHRSGEEHKKLALARLREAYPKTPFVLIGDSGQKDPDIYLTFARENPGAVKCIIIMKASDSSTERTEELREESRGYRDEGIPFHVCDDAVTAAQILHDLKLVDDITLVEVETEMGAVF